MRTWNGSEPTTCNLCGCNIIEVFIDGAVRPTGQWAIMCRSCHRLHGKGLGTGLGQRFRLFHGTWIDERDMPSAPINAAQFKALLALRQGQQQSHMPRNGGFQEPELDTMDL